jgi:hypothetical protein
MRVGTRDERVRAIVNRALLKGGLPLPSIIRISSYGESIGVDKGALYVLVKSDGYEYVLVNDDLTNTVSAYSMPCQKNSAQAHLLLTGLSACRKFRLAVSAAARRG